jgi:serine/threonine-protein kinase
VSDLQSRLQAALGGAYRIERELGGGGMSYVYVAEETGLGRKVVVKVLPPDMAAGVNAERFSREIRLVASLQHPHIVPVLAAGTAGDLVYYTMPLVVGESLRGKLARERQLPVAETVRILRDVVDALAYAHRQGVVHRDIKPDNVLVAHDHGLVTDFGVAKALGREGPVGPITTAGIAIGTPEYMAPEQAAGDPGTDHRCDLYAAGTLAYEMLAGRPPFDGVTPQAVLAAQLTEAPRPIAERRPDTPDALAAVIMRCLEKEPKNRWQTADDLLRALHEVITPMTTTPLAIPMRRARRSPLPWIVGAAAVSLALIVGLVWRGNTRVFPATTVAVFPFSVRGGQEIGYLGEGMVNLLSTSLDGAGGLHTVDPRALLALVHRAGSGVPDPSAARQMAAKLGAGLYVLGDIVEVGTTVRVSAAIYDRSRSEQPVGQASKDGRQGDVFMLVDNITTQLLTTGVGQNSQATRIASVTTSSLPALKAYLEGEQEFRAGQYRPAVDAFQRAIQADSQFALAFYRLSIAAEWALNTELSQRAAAQAVRLSGRLTEHDRLLLDALLKARRGEVDQAQQQFRAIVSTWPNDVESWIQLGEVLFHFGPYEGRPLAAAREPFERVVALEPTNQGAFVHLARLAAAEHRAQGADTLSRQAEQLAPEGERVLEMEVLRASVKGDTGSMRAAIRLERRADDATLVQGSFGAVWSDDESVARMTLEPLTDAARPRMLRAVGHVRLAYLDMLHGHARVARAEADSAEALDQAWGLEYRALLTLFPWLRVPRTDLERLRTDLARYDAAAVPRSTIQDANFSIHDGLHVPVRAYLLGQVEARLGNAAAAQQQAADLDRFTGPTAEMTTLVHAWARGVRAAVLESRGRWADAFEAEGPRVGNYEPMIFSPIYSQALERYRRAVLLDTLGRLDEAAAQYSGFPDFTFYDRVFQPPALYRLGLLELRRNRPSEARAALTRFVSLWKDCDPELKPMVDDARTRLEHIPPQ